MRFDSLGRAFGCGDGKTLTLPFIDEDGVRDILGSDESLISEDVESEE